MGLFDFFKKKSAEKCSECLRSIDGNALVLDNVKYCHECYIQKRALLQQTYARTAGNYNFEMMIEDVFLIRNHGVIVTGKIKRGTIHIHDTVTINGKSYTVTLIDVIPNQVEYAEEGMNAGLHLSTSDSDLFMRGDIVFANAVNKNASNDAFDKEKYIDDITFIRDIKHIQSGAWHQYDILLAARGYGWDMMKVWADYMSEADLEHVSQVCVGSLGSHESDITKSYTANGEKCQNTPELNNESGMLSVAGISKILKAPLKIVWINQTQVLRFFTFVDDELLIKKYAETVVRRSFGTENAMKLGKPIPEGQ